MICNFFRGWIICFWLNFEFFSRWTTGMTYIFFLQNECKKGKEVQNLFLKYTTLKIDMFVLIAVQSTYIKQVFFSSILQNKRKNNERNQYIQICQQQNMLDNHHPPPFNLIFKGVIHQQCSLVWPQLWSFKELNWLRNLINIW